MINIDYLINKVNTYKFIFYTLIYKYTFCYIFFTMFLICLFNRYVDIFCCNKIFADFITRITIYNLFIIPILTITNIILILIKISIYNFNKTDNNIENNKNNEKLNEIKKINNYFKKKFIIVTFYFFSFLNKIIILMLKKVKYLIIELNKNIIFQISYI